MVVWLAICCASRPCLAVIEALTPLAQLERDATAIAVVKVQTLDLDKQTTVLTLERTITGELSPPRVPIRLPGDNQGVPTDMLERLEVGQRLVLFVTETQTPLIGYAYTRGSWFQILGTRDGERVRWQFTHAEPYLRRTFRGETAQLVALLEAAAAGQGTLPAPTQDDKPGLGPKIDRAAPATIEPDLPAITGDPAGDSPATAREPTIPNVPATAATPTGELNPWYAVLGTVVIGLGGIVVLRWRARGTAC